ncbi:hypothetical protein [Rhizobium sp. Root651]|uniref:hypothetical protein n=1 Tax=Rhizobium sp. Root651 TaxID=1736577 RepID=UPI000713111F|nr:hypothetical protein [Rhizobium sp. Root651]KRA58153.1 hypothetical protein ASD85_16865 [Rhizobium sp. Root651]
MSKAIEDVTAERRRQVEKEGWSLDHDDRHSAGEMALAAGWYAFNSVYVGSPDAVGVDKGEMAGHFHAGYGAYSWPWDASWWKPTERRRDLVKAAALLIAEIERIDRLSTPPRSHNP